MKNIRCMPSYLSGEMEAKSQNISYLYLLCAGALSEKGVCIKSYKPDDKAQFILKLLRTMGAKVVIDKEGVSVKKGILFGTMANLTKLEEFFPLVCVMAGLSDKMFTQITGVRSLRTGSSDKVVIVSENLSKIGIALSEDDDDEVLVWADNEITGGSVDAHNDPHFAMALMIASCACNIALDIYEIEGLKSAYSDFIDEFNALGGKASYLD